MGATIHLAVGFDAVADDLAFAMDALGRKRMDGTFETVERVARALHANFKRLVVIISTDFAACHGSISYSWL
jgi:hypothetical protein